MAIEVTRGANIWEIGAASKGGRVELVDASGALLAKLLGDTHGATDRMLPFGGVNNGTYRPLRVDRMGNQGTTLHTTQFHLNIDGATLHSSLVAAATTMANSISTANGIQMNSAGATGAAAFTALTTRKHSPFMLRGPLQFRMRARLLKGAANSGADFGFGVPATNAIVTVGAYFLFNTDGSLRPAYAFNGAPVTGTDFASSIDPARTYVWDIIVHDDSLQFIVQDPATGAIVTDQSQRVDPASLRRFAAASRLPAFARCFNGGTAPATACQLTVGDWYVGVLDIDTNRPWDDTMGSLQMSLAQNPMTGAQLEQNANSTEPASATLSNTAAGYALMQGRFQFAAPLGAVTDYNLFGFTIPTGYQAKIKGFRVHTKNLVVASAVSGTLLEWSLGLNGASVNLATGGHVRQSMGSQSIPMATPVGGTVPALIVPFPTPLICESGTSLAVILRIPVGTNTATQIIGGTVNLDGYWE